MKPSDEDYARYRAVIVKFAERRMPSTFSAEDVAQEALLRLVTLPPDRTVRSPEAYLRTIAAHLIYEQRMLTVRSVVTFNSAQFDTAVDQYVGDSLEVLGRLEIAQRIDGSLGKLRALHSDIVLLRHLYGCSHEEIAEQLGISVHTAKKYLAKALLSLRIRR
jgi:RNA polymerase sigma factor (sigma-70 family)